MSFIFFFFFNDTATTEIYTLSLHDALPICPADGRSVIETSMRPVPVVLVQPGGKLGGAKPRVVIGASISPLPQRGLDKAFRLAVGARGVGAGEALGDAELATGAAKAARAVARSVVGQYPADADAEARVGGHRCPQESRCRCGFLVGQEVGESDAGVIINRHMQIFPALSVNASLAMAGNAAADRGEAPDFLDVEMEQIAGGGVLVADHGRRWFQVAHAAQVQPSQDAADGSAAQRSARCAGWSSA